MGLNSVFSFFFYNFIGFRPRPRLKRATPVPHGGDDSSFRLQRVREKEKEKEEEEEEQEESSSGWLRCCVCLSSMEEGEKKGIVTSVLPCLHEFHKVCVDRWFEECGRNTCPICRYSMEGGGDRDRDSHENGTQILTDEMVIWFSSFHTSGF